MLMHYCVEEENYRKRVVARALNDEMKPKFFCRKCKERIDSSQKNFYRLHRLGKRIL